MPTELPYLSNYKNVGELFQRIASAKKPESFTNAYLVETIGLKSSGDRQLITLLKSLGFLDGAGRPTAEYDQLKNPSFASKAIGAAVRRAYEGLYAANEEAQNLSGQELKGLISQVAGTDSNVTSKIQGTLSALLKLADFTRLPQDLKSESKGASKPNEPDHVDPPPRGGGLKPEFHYNIQVHLPANATEEVYLSIFNSLRKAFAS